MEARVAARNLQVGDVFPGGGGTITRILDSAAPGTVLVEVDYSHQRGPWNHGDPVLVNRGIFEEVTGANLREGDIILRGEYGRIRVVKLFDSQTTTTGKTFILAEVDSGGGKITTFEADATYRIQPRDNEPSEAEHGARDREVERRVYEGR